MKLESLVYLIFSNPFMLFMSFMVKKKNAQARVCHIKNQMNLIHSRVLYLSVTPDPDIPPK